MSENSYANNKLSKSDIAEMAQHNILIEPHIFDPERLRILTISYYDFDGKSHNDGKIMVLDASADYVAKIFEELYAAKFPIHQMKLMSEYSGDDELSMADNNSSALNQRVIAGQKTLSIHSYGLAIDINPVQNPFITFPGGVRKIEPAAGAKFLDRSKNEAGFVEKITAIFYKNGFNVWGGNWNDIKDYHHFQTSRALAELLVEMSAYDAKKFFRLHVEFLQNHSQELVTYMQNNGKNDVISNYKKSPINFMKEAAAHISN